MRTQSLSRPEPSFFFGSASLPDEDLLDFSEGDCWDAPSSEELSTYDLYAVWDDQLAFQNRR